MNPNRLTVGKITKTQGKQGEVTVQPLSDFPARLKKLEEVYLVDSQKNREQQVKIQRVKQKGNTFIFKFEGIDSVETANQFKNYTLQIKIEEISSLVEDQYYIFQLLGLKVFDLNGDFLGEIAEIWELPANDVFVIRKEKREILIPAIKEVVKSVDLEHKEMIIHLMPGLQ
ncbi:MAG: ribosome maturation factor RimM [Candidatus Edwardsbacteria bacterium]